MTTVFPNNYFFEKLTAAKISELMSRRLSIANLSIVSISLFIFSSILRLVDRSISWLSDSTAAWFSVISSILSVVIVILIVLAAIISFVAVILTLSNDWVIPKLQDMKLLWGLLGLFILGPIGPFIFSLLSKNVLNQVKNEFDMRQQNLLPAPQLSA